MKKKNILITGCSGYLAFNFIKENYQNYNFYCIFNKSKIPKKYFKKSLKFSNKNLNSLRLFVKKAKPDITIHMATKYSKFDNINLTKKTIDSNILFGTYLIQALNECGYKKILNFGSIWQNSGTKKKYLPYNFYAATKEAFEKILEYFVLKKKFKALTLKIYDTYGYNDNRKKFLQFIINKIKEKKPIQLNDKSRKLSLVHYRDINTAINIAIEYILNKNFTYKTFSLRSNIDYTLENIIDIFKKIHNIDFKVKWKKNKNEIRLNKSLENLPGWKPKVSLKEGLKEFIL